MFRGVYCVSVCVCGECSGTYEFFVSFFYENDGQLCVPVGVV